MENRMLPITFFAREVLFDSSDEEDDDIVIEKVDNYAEFTVPNMDDHQFKRHFRMTPTTFQSVITTMARLRENGPRVGFPPMAVEKELMITLWYLGNIESFRSVADRFGVTKSTAWDVLYRTSRLLLRVNAANNIICWPSQERQATIANYFNRDGFTGVVGCIDGSHIKITAPKENKNSYVNRKGYHSILLQGVCDHRKLFTDVYAGEVGSLHDYTLYRKSHLYNQIRNGETIFHNDSYLLGDLAYKLATNLLVGFKDNGHLTPRQKRFNVILSKIRVVIENAFALLKGRFRRLKFVETIRMDLIPLLVVTACVLHNICILNDEYHDDIMDIDEEIREGRENMPNNLLDILDEQEVHNAIAKRNNIVNALELEGQH